MKENKFISILIFTFGIVISSFWIGYSIQKSAKLQVENIKIESDVLNLSEVSEYLKMTEEEVKGIILIEEINLNTYGTYTGEMFPYFTVDNKQYFHKEEINEWIKYVSMNHMKYDTTKRIMYN